MKKERFTQNYLSLLFRFEPTQSKMENLVSACLDGSTDTIRGRMFDKQDYSCSDAEFVRSESQTVENFEAFDTWTARE